jgi:BirA family biotin operon repressor/biotin-[acetyl-CoA-carboxylase] ligase
MELLPTVSSTNTYLKGLDAAPLPEGYVVISDAQSEGRGRFNRSFYSPAREGVYLSVLLKPSIPLSETPFLTICAAVAVARAIENVCGIRVDIKWVNDICHNGKKLCGILTEAFILAELRSVDFVVVGIGVNTGHVAPEVSEVATSVYEASGVRGVRVRLTAEILNQFESVYIDYTLRGGRREILDAYSGRMSIIGRQAEADVQGATRLVTIMGVDDSGGLIARRADGGICHIETGEIKFL